MAVISRIELYERPEQFVISVRKTIDFFSQFEGLAGQTFDAILQYAEKNGILFSGCPFTCYHNTDLAQLDVEIGFPVPERVKVEDKQLAGRFIPAQKMVCGISQGPYSETDALMAQIFEWIAANGLEPKGGVYHYYLNDDSRPESELLVELVVPVK
ncbi:GyrI-like domain-containing protein [Christensenellaceae bacterium OttesenSCG-928-K19]|nr:GyrI-like domain-containing protein [Christensenellaceae bacterium OttesenSCG-928-K19]